MVAETTKAAQNPFDDVDEQFLSDDAFKPTEYFSLAEIVSIETVPMPDVRLRAMRVDPDSEEFRSVFPNGAPALEIGLKGIDVDWAFNEDHVNRIQIPMFNVSGPNVGQPKGDRSQLQIVTEAFNKVFGVKPFGRENRAKLIGRKARWGQHIDTFEDRDTKERRSYRWDIPRQELPADFVYTGDVRTVGRREGSENGAAPSGVASEMSNEEAVEALLEIVVGKRADEVEDLCDAALELKSLPGAWVTAAASKQLLAKLYEEGHIDQEAGVITLKS